MTTAATQRQQRSSASAVVFKFRSPPAKHWAPFVRGCVPVRSDPGHDKGRLANRYAVKQALRGAFRLREIVKGGFSLPRLALASGPLFTFFIPVIATVFQM